MIINKTGRNKGKLDIEDIKRIRLTMKLKATRFKKNELVVFGTKFDIVWHKLLQLQTEKNVYQYTVDCFINRVYI